MTQGRPAIPHFNEIQRSTRMKRISAIGAGLLTLGLCAITYAQMGFRTPDIRGVWNPVVGAGGVYQMERGGESKSNMEFSIVGTETVDGKPGYWLEMSMTDPRSGGQMLIKHLMVHEGDRAEIKRMVMQAPGQPPIELPAAMTRQGPRPTQSADIRKEAERVGTEEITTPAGTFTCEHYRTKDRATDVWVSEKVAPWGLIKMTGRDTTMTLIRVVNDATSRITGTPQKFDPAEMMRRQGRP
jgi:hypothetical protein